LAIGQDDCLNFRKLPIEAKRGSRTNSIISARARLAVGKAEMSGSPDAAFRRHAKPSLLGVSPLFKGRPPALFQVSKYVCFYLVSHYDHGSHRVLSRHDHSISPHRGDRIAAGKTVLQRDLEPIVQALVRSLAFDESRAILQCDPVAVTPDIRSDHCHAPV
jgi:hypothetical protein